MRKKIISVLLAMCMVLALLPAAAFAAELTDAQIAALKAQGYTDEEIANVLVVSEDTVIDTDETRLIIVVGKCTVTVRGAVLSTGIVVAPGAEASTVVLESQADVNAVVVLEKSAEVVVHEEAKAANVTVAAPEAKLTVAGSVQNVTVNEAAESAQITVSGTADVAALEVSAPQAAVAIEGSVQSVTVTETAQGAGVTVADTATVDTVSIDASGVTAEINTDTNVVLGDNAANVEVVAGEGTNVAVSGNTDSLTEGSNVGGEAKPDEGKKDETPVDPGTPSTPAATEVIIANGGSATGKGSGAVAVAIPKEEGDSYVYCVITKDPETNKVEVSVKSAVTQKGSALGLTDTAADMYYDVITYTVAENAPVNETICQVTAEQKKAIDEAVGKLDSAIKAKADADAAYSDEVKAAGETAENTLKDEKVKAAGALKDLVTKSFEELTSEEKETIVTNWNTINDGEDISEVTANVLTTIQAAEKYTTALATFNSATAAKEAAAAQEKAKTDAETAVTTATGACDTAVKAGNEIEVDITYEAPKTEPDDGDGNTGAGGTTGEQPSTGGSTGETQTPPTVNNDAAA